MNDKELLKAWGGAFDKPVPLTATSPEEMAKEILHIRLRAVAQVGIREVVEWVEEQLPKSHGYLSWRKWEAQLKDWGI